MPDPHPADHPENVDPELGMADKVTVVLTSKYAELDTQAFRQEIPATMLASNPDPDKVPEPVPDFVTVSNACWPANTSTPPMRDLTTDTSAALTTPEIPKSYEKFDAPVAAPERDFTAPTSMLSIRWLLSTSPTRKPTDAATLTPFPLTLVSDIVARLKFGTPTKLTITSFPLGVAETVPIAASVSSTAETVPVAVII